MKKQKGITLVALIITIIILLILAGISISALTGDEGLFSKSREAVEKTKKAQAQESLQLMLTEIKMQVMVEEERNTSILDCEKLKGKDKVEKVEYIDDRNAEITYDGYKFKVNEQLTILDMQVSENQSKPQEGIISDTEYIINNETLQFSKIVTVGKNEELKTVKEALDYLCDNGYKTGGGIVLKEGTHDTANIHTGTSYNINSKYNEMEVSIIADSPGNTFMTSGEMGLVQNNANYWMECKFYRIVFTLPVYSDLGSKGFHLDFDNKANEYYNCVFLPPVGGFNKIVNDAAINVYNCLFLGGEGKHYTTDPLSGTAQNCASNTTVIDPVNGTKTTCLTNVAVNENYNIISGEWRNKGTGKNPDGTQAHIGVYGGKYAWPHIELDIDKVNNKIHINTTECLNEITEIKYLYGTASKENVLNSGKVLKLENNQTTIENIENGRYTIVFLHKDGKEITRTITIENANAVSSYKINNETLQFSRIITVGEKAECATVKEALDYLCDNGYKTSGGIVLKEGTHDTANIHTGTSYSMNAKYNEMKVSIIADSPGNTFMTSGEMSVAGNNSNYWIECKFYRIIFTLPVYSDVGSKGFHLDMDNKANEYYNCVFLPPVGGYNKRVSDAAINVYNCLFLGGKNDYYSNDPLNGIAQDSASTTTVIAPANGTKETCLTNITVDENYNITSGEWKNKGTGTNPDGTQAHIGVYGGKYAWPHIELDVDKVNKKIHIDTTECIFKTTQIKYLYGINSKENVLNNGKVLKLENKKATIENIENGIYTMVFLFDNGKEVTKRITVENVNAVSLYKINNEILQFSRIITVGENAECATVKEALDHLCDNGYKTGGAIILKEGRHNTADIHTGTSSNINPKYNEMSVSIIGDNPGKTYMTAGEMIMVENNVSQWIELKFYRIIFTKSNISMHLNADEKINEYYNCVFETPVGGYNGKISNAAVSVYNCLFLGGKNDYYSNDPLNGIAQDSASTTTVIAPANGTKETCLTNITVDENYNITSGEWKNKGTGTNPDGTQAHIGVYGGKYAW